MTALRIAAVTMAWSVLGVFTLCAEGFSSYRGFQFGMSLAAGAKRAGSTPTMARTLHERPALIQEVDWRPNSPLDAKNADAVHDGILSFYDGQLYRIVITYDRYKVEGMSVADMVQAISMTYGMATEPGADIPYHSNYGEVAPVLARWEDPQYSYNLIQTGNRSSFAMIMYSKRLDTLAQAAIAESALQDAIDAPQKAVDLRKQQDEESRVKLEKSRSVNLPNFRP
jgi:hypothetical protein